MLGSGTSYSQILNNQIGFDRFGLPTLPNIGTPIAVNASTDNTISGNDIACFAAGTRIATKRGPVAVEALRVGDQVRTLLGGRWGEIIWIGHRHIDCGRHPESHKIWPVRVAADAFRRGQPSRPVLLSPDHAVYVSGVLIPVNHLINGRSIRQLTLAQFMDYHIELPRHDVILADGLRAESYLDTSGRVNFSNGGGTIRLFPDFMPRPEDNPGLWEALACASLMVVGPDVDAARRRVDARCPVPVRRRAQR